MAMSLLVRRLLVCLGLTLLVLHAATARVRPVELCVRNGTGATLEVYVSHSTGFKSVGRVPPHSRDFFHVELKGGYNDIRFRPAFNTRGRSALKRIILMDDGATSHVEVSVVPADFGLTTMKDPSTARFELKGTWERSDGHIVRFTGRAGGEYTGTIVVLTPLQRDVGFSVGEQTFKLKPDMDGQYSGTIKWRGRGRPAWWQPVTVNVRGDSMTGGAGLWRRVGDR